MSARQEMNAWLDEQIRQAGIDARDGTPCEQAALAARIVALAQVRAQVWKQPR